VKAQNYDVDVGCCFLIKSKTNKRDGDCVQRFHETRRKKCVVETNGIFEGKLSKQECANEKSAKAKRVFKDLHFCRKNRSRTSAF